MISIQAAKKTPRKMNDTDIRSVLRSVLKGQHRNGLVVDELGLLNGEARIDLAVINDRMSGYEIKSERDSLKRLLMQVDAYNQVFDEITLVVAARHLRAARKIIPRHWGIIQASWSVETRAVMLRPRREAKPNPNQDASALARLLWRDEVLKVLESAGLDRGYRSKPREILSSRLAQNFSVDELRPLILAAISSRENWRTCKPPVQGPRLIASQ
jgi:hypothetical protein